MKDLDRRWYAIAGLALATAIFLAYVPAHRGFFDVGVYHGAVHYWLRDGGQIYDFLRPRRTTASPTRPSPRWCSARSRCSRGTRRSR
ncbi:hypothetical protein Pflav_006750 [Phytohabitans flavus]|uniref:Uncharacterized protein n=1 Tax=Phytohabitans flavus TaxID=1076124 RepID=A0A6F8XKC5_9ACTN|nr:hypothetical protein [Phytohabitans flavus]BCB74265.1 hypothetical protein Pflav_006750 [Phytohabitans flavus]